MTESSSGHLGSGKMSKIFIAEKSITRFRKKYIMDRIERQEAKGVMIPTLASRGKVDGPRHEVDDLKPLKYEPISVGGGGPNVLGLRIYLVLR